MECYVFVDNSNLWIEGKKAQGKKLKDADIDNQYRVDFGKLLNGLVNECRNVSKAILYGSEPPPNDSVWKAAREKNFHTRIFTRSGSGREKEVDTAMAYDIGTHLCELDTLDNVVFIIVTGDRDLKYPIERVLEKGVPVELWSWEDAMAREFRQLANDHTLFTAHCLDSVAESFSFTSVMSPRDTKYTKYTDPAHAIVYRNVPGDKSFLYMLADHMYKLHRVFNITPVKSAEGKQDDLIVEFPGSDPEIVFGQLHELKGFTYQPCSYPEYKKGWKQTPQPILTTNRFETLGEIDCDPLPDEGKEVIDNTEVAASLEQSTEHGSQEVAASLEQFTEHGSLNFDEWETKQKKHRTPGKMTDKKRQKEKPCKWGDHCAMASECPNFHTEEERKLFERFSYIKFQYRKAKECDKKELHTTPEQRMQCSFAHDSADSWCLGCGMYGHLTDNCQVK